VNYYNPYFSPIAYTPSLGAASNVSSSKGLFSSLFGGGKLTSFINGTQKTLNIINQAIPLVKQVSPVVKNAKTMFKVMSEFKKVDKPTTVLTNNERGIDDINETNISSNNKQYKNLNDNGPTFFI